jgi:hypothetical protein
MSSSTILSEVVLNVFYYDNKKKQHSIKRINLKELVERGMSKNLKQHLLKLKEFFNQTGDRFIRAEIITTDFYFIYPLYNYKTLDDIIENILIFQTMDLLEGRNDKEFTLVVKDKLNKNRLEFSYFKDTNGFYKLYQVKMYPKDF